MNNIKSCLERLKDEGVVSELRVLNTPNGTVSGYYESFDKLAEEAKKHDGKGLVCITLNPVNKALLARATNRTVKFPKYTTQDSDIDHIHWFFIDLDPIRPAGISATETEHTNALNLAKKIRDSLAGKGWPRNIML